MKARLLGDFLVEITPRTPELGGSWKIDGGGRIQVCDPKLLAFLDRQIRELGIETLLDVGASTGSFCLLAKRHPNLHVLAFEPNPAILEVLRQNIALNGLESRVRAFPFALYDKNGAMELKVPAQSGLACLGSPRRFKKWKSVRVKVRRLDGLTMLLAREGFSRVDAIKIDTEGAEVKVLRGAATLIETQKPKLLLEYCSRNTRQFGYEPEVIKGLLKSWGYVHFKHFRVDLWATT